jgi:ATP-binding cassette, subfamily B (MDR/TAP), member 1
MQVGPNMPAFGKAAAAAGAVFDVLDREIDSEPTKGKMIPHCTGHVKFQNVSFSYPTRPVEILSNSTLEFPDKTVTAIVGPSGSGKSSIFGLLERWFEPTEGEILLDGHDIKDLDVKWLRNQIAFVQQEPQLFNTTIFENVADGLIGSEVENATDEIKLELVKEACSRANASEFIDNLPNASTLRLRLIPIKQLTFR